MHSARLLVAVLLVAAAAFGAEPESEFAADPNYWALAFENDTPKPLVLDDPAGRLTYYWYMVYRVKNPNPRALPCRLDLSLKLRLKDEDFAYPDVNDRMAEQRLEKKIEQRPLLNCVEVSASLIKPGESREGVAIFRLGHKAQDFDAMTIFARGLAAQRTVAGKGDPTTGRKVRERVLNLRYSFAASKWTTGKELKLNDDLWTLEDVDVSNLNHTDRSSEEEAAKKLKELQDRIKKLRDQLPPEEPKPPDSASARQGATELGAGSLDGQTTAKIAQALRDVAAKMRACRATFVETVGRQGERQTKAEGTVYLGKDGKFAIERILAAGTPEALKEFRVFDGNTLWAQTTTKEFGDSVRRCDREKTRRQWHSVDGRPEVDFATAANPVQAWRLFGSDLVHLGVERLEKEGAYVFEVRPPKALEPVLTGPLSSEVLYKAAGRRVRFWVGARSGFQLRMRVYDDDGNVVAALECTQLDLGAHVPADLFTYTAPAGAKVVDVNAAVVDRDGPAPVPSN